jgi:hypothetical protein
VTYFTPEDAARIQQGLGEGFEVYETSPGSWRVRMKGFKASIGLDEALTGKTPTEPTDLTTFSAALDDVNLEP